MIANPWLSNLLQKMLKDSAYLQLLCRDQLSEVLYVKINYVLTDWWFMIGGLFHTTHRTSSVHAF